MKTTDLLIAALMSFGSLAAIAQPLDVALDGRTGDWPAGTYATADSEYLYFRLPFGSLRSLLTEGKPVDIRVDLDSDSATGKVAEGLGAELEMTLRHRKSWRDPFFLATAYGAEGQATTLDFARIQPLAQPNHAAEEFEVRIRRDAHAALLAETKATGRIRMTDARRIREDRQTRTEDVILPFTVTLPPGQPVQLVEATLPEKRAGSMRIVAHNVLWQNPEEDPAPFARLYQALDPDLYLIQEWGQDPWTPEYEGELEEWFRKHVDPQREWTALRTQAYGVAIVTHHPVIGRGPLEVRAETITPWTFPIRVATAAVLTPEGPFAVASIHLKASGALNTPEDQRRFDEARAIRGIMERLTLLADGAPGDVAPITVVGGDFNHNGHPRVPETAFADLDVDGSALTMAFTPVLGTDSRYTHGGPAFGHRRSFLDAIGYPDARSDVSAAFVLDTEILSDSSLAAMGLERSDTSASDHLPVVVDLDPKD